MPDHNHGQNCRTTDGPTGKSPLSEKILYRIGFYGFLVTGSYAIASVDLLWGLVYVGIALLSMALFAYFLCSHCPHPFHHSDCLTIPSGLITKAYRFRPEPMSNFDTVGCLLSFTALVAIPQYWLFQNLILLAVFWVLCIAWAAAHRWRYCLGGRCLNRTCPAHPERKKALREYD